VPLKEIAVADAPKHDLALGDGDVLRVGNIGANQGTIALHVPAEHRKWIMMPAAGDPLQFNVQPTHQCSRSVIPQNFEARSSLAGGVNSTRELTLSPLTTFGQTPRRLVDRADET
jgi:hypothetical protein